MTGFYEWGQVDANMDKILSVGGIPVIGFKLQHAALMQGAPQASFTGPVGMENPSETPLWPPPYAKGYHEGLYDDSLELARRMRDFYRPTVSPFPSACVTLPATPARIYIVFHPEPWAEWPLGANPGSAQWNNSLNAYILSFLTVRKAFEDAQNETATIWVDFRFSHGSIPRRRILPREWLAEGEANPDKRTRLLDQYRSYFERVPNAVYNRLESKASKVEPYTFESWQDVVDYSSAASGAENWKQNRADDDWLERMIDWTCQGFFDFNTQHPHGKTLYADLERLWVDDEIVSRTGGAPRPWILTEADFERSERKERPSESCGPTWWEPVSQEWPYEPSWTGETRAGWLAGNLDRFVMEDYMRKWCSALAHESWALGWDLTALPGPVVRPGDAVTTFCSSVLSGNNLCRGPHRDYFSLFEKCWPSNSLPCLFGAQVCGPEAIAPPGEQAIQPTFVRAAFEFLSNEIGLPGDVITVHDDQTYAHYRFDLTASAGKYVDAVWRRSLFDADASTMPLTVNSPDPTTYGEFVRKFMDPATGTLTCVPANGTASGTQVPLTIGQAPQFVVWTQ